jgi:hypothetical protein
MSALNSWRPPASCLRVITLASAIVAAPIGGAKAQPADNVTIERLQEELARRDAIIIDLEHRMQALEAGHTLALAATLAQAAPVVAAAGPQAPSAQVPGNGAAQGGGLLVDEMAAKRALERTLVQEGAALLSPGRAEFTPGFTFSPSHIDYPVLVTTSGGTYVGQRALSLRTFDWRLGLNVGLPFDSQLELSVPYRLVSQELKDSVGGVAQVASSAAGSGLGDVGFGLAKTLLGSRSSDASVIGRLTWIASTGAKTDNGVVLGSGNSALAAQLSAAWRIDPIVLLASTGYSHYFTDGAVRRGDAVGLSLGAAVALSPESALTFSLDQTYASDIEIRGLKQSGTDLLESTFNVSASTIVGQGLMLRVTAGVGLTPDAPDYQFGVGVSVPMRFNVK